MPKKWEAGEQKINKEEKRDRRDRNAKRKRKTRKRVMEEIIIERRNVQRK